MLGEPVHILEILLWLVESSKKNSWVRKGSLKKHVSGPKKFFSLNQALESFKKTTIVGAHLVDMAKSFLVPQSTCLKWMDGWMFGDFHPFAIRKDLGIIIIWDSHHPTETLSLKNLDLHVGCLEKVKTWNLTNTPLERKIIFQTIIFRFYVNLPGCIPNGGFMIRIKTLSIYQTWMADHQGFRRLDDYPI